MIVRSIENLQKSLNMKHTVHTVYILKISRVTEIPLKKRAMHFIFANGGTSAALYVDI